ncbi:hypothetical protein ACQKDZ_19855, partial [Alkalihalobacillus sp. NPDC078480]
MSQKVNRDTKMSEVTVGQFVDYLVESESFEGLLSHVGQYISNRHYKGIFPHHDRVEEGIDL